MSPRALLLLLALLLTALAYAGALGYGFVYDDTNQIVNNPTVQSWRYIPRYFSSHVWSHNSSTVLYYRPLFLLWLLANHAVFGLHPAGWHAAAIGLHLLVTLLFYRLASDLTLGDRRAALIAAGLFGLHPIHVESVAWISGATDPLLGVFVIGAMLCHMRGRLAGALGCALLAMLTKETAVVLPGLIFVYELLYHGERRRARNAVLHALPYAAVVLALIGLRLAVLHTLTTERSAYHLREILLSWPKLLVLYIRHLVWPVHLSVFYDPVVAAPPGWSNLAAPALALLVIAAALAWWAIRSRAAAFWACWFALLLMPALDVTLHITFGAFHDRYLYLPSMAFCALLAMALAHLSRLRFPAARPLAYTAAAGLAALYLFGVVVERRPWSSDAALAENALALSPANAEASYMRANALMVAGDPTSAIPFLLQALGRRPFDGEVLWALGFCYTNLDQLPEAEYYLTRALREQPSDPKSHLAMAIVRFKRQQLDDAEAEARRAIALQRVAEGYQFFHFWLGNILEAKGDPAGAIREYQLEPVNGAAAADAREHIDRLRSHALQ